MPSSAGGTGVGGGGSIPLVFPIPGGGGGNIELQNPTVSALFGGPSIHHQPSPSPFPDSPFPDSDAFNPFVFFQNYIQTLRAGGANIQFVFDNNNSGDPGFRLPANIGDYFIGPGFEQLIQQLAENDPNRHGPPPASKSAVLALPNIKITDQLLSSDSSQCAVCKDTFDLGVEAKQMPCKHIYHCDCILPWLEIHNSCPVCRYELPTDDPDYEQRTRGTRLNVAAGSTNSGGTAGGGGGSNGGIGGGGDSQENPQTPRTVERRFRISLPWPFRAFGSPAEASNSRNGDNEGESNAERRGDQHFESGTRQEDLD